MHMHATRGLRAYDTAHTNVRAGCLRLVACSVSCLKLPLLVLHFVIKFTVHPTHRRYLFGHGLAGAAGIRLYRQITLLGLQVQRQPLRQRKFLERFAERRFRGR